ncbi:MAG: hypothetical protein ABIW76_07985 [Fibrobacteria bacterium]
MKKAIALIVLLQTVWVGAKVCEQTYHLQEATQYTLTGNSATTLQAQGASVKLTKSMSGVTLLNDSTEYKMITDWDGKGTCETYVKREITFAYRKRGTATIAPLVSMDYGLKLNDGLFPFKTPGWDDYWFGLTSKVSGDTISLYDAVGKFKANSMLNLWYGNATMKRSLYSSTGSFKGSSTYYYPEQTSHSDSAALTAVLLQSWKTFANNDTQKVDFTVQLIKLTYDSIPSPVTNVRGLKAGTSSSGFQATQSGNLVLIHPGHKQTTNGESVSLFGMMGNKIATLHPTGYVYQWNGKTSFGTDAPTGVYFLQSGGSILGKFFYTR